MLRLERSHCNNDNNSDIKEMSVFDLDEELENLYGTTFQVFQYSRQGLHKNKASPSDWKHFFGDYFK